MSEISYDPQSRRRLCVSCETTSPSAMEGGVHTCPECSAAVDLPPRRLAPLGDPSVQMTAEAERVRVETLRRQAKESDWDPGNRYDTSFAPEELLSIDDMSVGDDKTLRTVLDLYKQNFQHVVGGTDAAGKRRLFWLTTKLFNLYTLRAEPLKAWGAVQTSLDVLTDRGYQQILRCLAADLARIAGQLDHAEAWLAMCDPASKILEPDYYWRTAVAKLLGARGQWEQALATELSAVMGYPVGWAITKIGLRISALAKLGRPEDAEGALQQGFAKIGSHKSEMLKMCNADPLLDPAREVWNRLDKRTSNRRRMAFLVFFLVGATVVGWLGLRLWNKASYHASWRPAKAKLIEVKSLESQQYHITRMYVSVSYTFRVKGKTYRGNHARPDKRLFKYTDARKAMEKLASLKRLTHVTVYYDPANPKKSALERKPGKSTRYALLTWLGALLLLAIAGLILRYHLRRRRLLRGKRT